MKNTTNKVRMLKLIASHALVIGIFTQPYLIYAWGDIYNIVKMATGMATEQAMAPVVNQNLTASMSFLSTTALVVSAISFGLYLIKRPK